MNVKRRLVGGLAGLALLLALLAAPAAATGTDPGTELDDALRDAAVGADEADVDPPDDNVAVFSADVRVDGQRVDEQWYFALGYDDAYPYFASLLVLVDADSDEWAPICLGYLLGDEDDEGVLFVGGSTLGGDDDGCMVVGLGDDSGVVFGAIELEGDAVLTAAMYAFG